MYNIEIEFGGKLKSLRKERKLTQKALAKKIFVSPSYISKLESGVERPTPKVITLLALELNVSTSYFITGENDEFFKNDLWLKREKDDETIKEINENIAELTRYFKATPHNCQTSKNMI